MRLTIERSAALTAVAKVRGSSSTAKDTIPILGFVLLEATADALVMTTTNLDMQARVAAAARRPQERGAGMTGRFNKPRPFPRPADLSPAARGIERARWREFVAQALDHGQRAADGAEHDKGALWELTRHAHSTGTTPFPVDGASAAKMARSLAELAGALVGVAVTGVRRVALGHAVVGLARGLDVLLHDAATAEFQATTGRQFKDD